MVEKKSLGGVIIIGWYFVLIGAIISISYFVDMLSNKPIVLPDTFAMTMFIGIPLLLLSIFGKYPVIVPFELPYLHNRLNNLNMIVPFGWTLFIFLCGIGILQKRNIARITVILLSIIRIVVLCLSVYIHPIMPTLFSYTPNAQMGLHQYLLAAIFPVIYIIYFTRPKVKEQFK